MVSTIDKAQTASVNPPRPRGQKRKGHLSRLLQCILPALFLLTPTLASAATLDVPSPGDNMSGLGVIHGWKCTAEGKITVAFNGGTPISATYGSPRGDTRAVCEDDGNNGFYTYWNWAILGDGEHTVVAYDNGVEFARSTFTVTTAGEEFVLGAQARVRVPDFPSVGETTWFAWNQSTQHLEMEQVRERIETEAVNALLEPIREKHKVPALAGGIIHAGELIGVGAVGVRRVGSPEQGTVQDRWHLGSCTKAMTATLIATLVDEGLLSWQTTIGDVFPDLSMANPGWQVVTVEQLLAHQSGLRGWQNGGGLFGPLWPQLSALSGPLLDQRRQAVQLILEHGGPVFPPGTRTDYANFGYLIAGAMAEAVTGQVWEALMAERLFVPLSIASADFGLPGNRGTNSQPRGHFAGTPLEPRVPEVGEVWPEDTGALPPVIGPAGVVHSSLGDWGKFVAQHLAGARGESDFLEPETFQKLHTPLGDTPEEELALGWAVTEGVDILAGGRVLSHIGSAGTSFAYVVIVPHMDMAVLVATNEFSSFEESIAIVTEATLALVQHFVEE
jgi:CubicO group peptidase (beta-lactamase class C family)